MKTKQDFGKERIACCKFYELILMKLLKAQPKSWWMSTRNRQVYKLCQRS